MKFQRKYVRINAKNPKNSRNGSFSRYNYSHFTHTQFLPFVLAV